MTTFEKAREAFDAISVATYYGMEMRHQLSSNPAALAAAEALLTELRRSNLLATRMEGGGQ